MYKFLLTGATFMIGLVVGKFLKKKEMTSQEKHEDEVETKEQ